MAHKRICLSNSVWYNGLNAPPHLSLYIEILTPNVMVLKSGALAKQLEHEGGALMIKISALMKETSESFSIPFCHIGVQQTVFHLLTRSGSSLDIEFADISIFVQHLEL